MKTLLGLLNLCKHGLALLFCLLSFPRFLFLGKKGLKLKAGKGCSVRHGDVDVNDIGHLLSGRLRLAPLGEELRRRRLQRYIGSKNGRSDKGTGSISTFFLGLNRLPSDSTCRHLPNAANLLTKTGQSQNPGGPNIAAGNAPTAVGENDGVVLILRPTQEQITGRTRIE